MPPRLKSLSKAANICARCAIRQQRLARSAHTKVDNRSFIALDGLDAAPFLQGLVTANLARAPQIKDTKGETTWSDAIYTAFLNAQGRILNDVLIHPNTLLKDNDVDIKDKFLIEVDSRSAEALYKHLKKRKLRSKFKMRLLGAEELETWAQWDGDEGPSSTPDPINLHKELGPVIWSSDPRPGLASRIILPSESKFSSRLREDTVNLRESREYTLRRMSYGVAEGQGEIISESSLPQECNIDIFNGIDFRKGCYLGQELTIRTHHTGVVRKRILPVRLSKLDDSGNDQQPTASSTQDASGPTIPVRRTDKYRKWDHAQPVPGCNISKLGGTGSKGRSAGKYLGGIGNIGLAICRLEMMTDIQLTDNTTTFDRGQVWKVSWEDEETTNELQVEAFVPQWMREKLIRLEPHNEEEGVD